MLHKLSSVLLLITVLTFGMIQVAYAEDANATTGILMNLRTGPDANADIITSLKANIPVVVEARNSDIGWLLVHVKESKVRGWGKTTLLKITSGLKLSDLPVSTEQIGNPNPPKLLPAPQNVPKSAVKAPVIPVITSRIRSVMRGVFQKGQKLGNNPRVFSKVGDCHTDHPAFFDPFGTGSYNLGEYGSLQDVISYFSVAARPGTSNSFNIRSQAAHSAFTSEAVLEGSQYLDPNVCNANESPLACEYRIDKPSIAIIDFGVVDVELMTATQFNHYMRYIVLDTLNAGIIPILSTAGDNARYPDKSRQFNQIVAKIAAEKGIPLINLEAALAPLPNQGMDPDGLHLSRPADVAQTGVFSGENLQYGYTMRNLVTLQTLDEVVKQIMK